jgi:hypothetical protein
MGGGSLFGGCDEAHNSIEGPIIFGILQKGMIGLKAFKRGIIAPTGTIASKNGSNMVDVNIGLFQRWDYPLEGSKQPHYPAETKRPGE